VTPLLSVCIPAYNRARLLPALLDSVLGQSFDDYEIVITEDGSPERADIRAVVADRAARPGGSRIRYVENAENLGYDANFRAMLRAARGEHCFIMGNDDLLCPGALATVADAIRRHPDVGVVLRSLSYFEGDPSNVVRTTRYFPDERLVEPGPDAVVAFFRRLVVMSGIVLRRDDALACETDRFDGTLFYQHHVASNILLRRPGLFVPQVLVLYRLGGVPDFGVNARERGRFVPGAHPPSTDLNMIRGLLRIARGFDEQHGTAVAPRILRDCAHYSYPTLAKQAGQPRRAFARFYADLAGLGYWRSPFFHAYALLLAALGARRVDALVDGARRRLGHTPSLGGWRVRRGARTSAGPPTARERAP
jgi:glycosyltransferase involved in cell wall biosynthesis